MILDCPCVECTIRREMAKAVARHLDAEIISRGMIFCDDDASMLETKTEVADE